MAGISLMEICPLETMPLTKFPVPIISRQTPPRAQARIRMVRAGIMVFMPSIMPVINSFMVISLLGRYIIRATRSPAKVPRVSPATGFSPIASEKLAP